MEFYDLDLNAKQVQELLQLKQVLIRAKNLAENVQRQMNNMTHTQQQAQFGIPAELSETAFETTINDAVTALNSNAILNLISKMG